MRSRGTARALTGFAEEHRHAVLLQLPTGERCRGQPEDAGRGGQSSISPFFAKLGCRSSGAMYAARTPAFDCPLSAAPLPVGAPPLHNLSLSFAPRRHKIEKATPQLRRNPWSLN